jgi:hypothetical protein
MTMHDDGDEDIRLTRLLQSVRADADPALWTRVRARIGTPSRVPWLLAWAMRPAALAASLGLFLASAALALVLASGSGVSSGSNGDEYATLGEALVAERDSDAAATPAVAPPRGGAARDSGGAR